MSLDSEFNVNDAYTNAWIVYINGLEVPASSVSVSYGVGDIPEAEIVLVPDSSIQRFGAEDRVAVQIFYLDVWYGKPEFRLLFDGEIVSWGYLNTRGGRNITLVAIDYAQIFTQIFFFFMSNIDDLAKGASNVDIGVRADGVFTAGLPALFPYSLFAEGLITPEGSGSAPLIKRPIDYVYNLVRGLIQTNLPNRSLPASAFFAPWVRRTKFHNRFVALPFLEDSQNPGVFPILRAVQSQYAVQAVQMLTSHIGSSGSIWDVFNTVLQTLMMELVLLPTPAAVQSDYATLQIRGPAVRSEPTNPIFLTSYFTKPQLIFGLPPTCNVFFPSQISSFSYQENFATQPTRIYVNDESLPELLNVTNMTEGMSNLVRDAMTVAHPEEIDAALRVAKNVNGKNVLLYPEEFYRGPVIRRMRAPLWFTFLHRAQDKQTDMKNMTEEQQRAWFAAKLPTAEHFNIYKVYAAYEYAKERYATRSAGVSLSGFNPYPVPGFPCAVFDHGSSQNHIFGYLTKVQHVLGTRDASTRISISYGRTFSESFKNLRRQIDLENAAIVEASEKDDKVNVERMGAIALSPAEPLGEIRNVVQNFERAEQFYQALFHRSAAPAADKLTQAQLSAELQRQQNERSDALGVTPLYVDAPAPPPNKPAAFYYPNIIQFTDGQGNKQKIKLKGIDSTTRDKFYEILGKMRSGVATEEELQYVSKGLEQAPLKQGEKDMSPTPDIERQIALAEKLIRDMTTSTNVQGGLSVVPSPEAETYFEANAAAMKYNARPICTLDEYLAFLGDLAVPEGKFEANAHLAGEDPRTFPAPFYTRIRRYQPGPPPEDTIIMEGAAHTVSVRAGFPDSVVDWDELLLAYRQNILWRTSPYR